MACVAHAATLSTAGAQSPPMAQDIARSEARMRIATAAIDVAAAHIFRDGGERYTSPHIVGYERSVLTGCGLMKAGNAYACRMDGNIYYDRAFIAYLMTRAAGASGTDGSMAVIFPIAHEWGHILQYMMGLDYSKYDTSEHDADCLAGVLIAASRSGAPLRPNDLADAQYTMQFLGDPPMATGEWASAVNEMNARSGNRGGFSNALGNHGNSAERMKSFRDGLRSNFRFCVGNTPRFARSVAPNPTGPQSPALARMAIHWFVNKTADAYDLAVSQHKPIVLATGDFNAPYFQRLKNEVFSSPELAQLAPYAVFVYADPSHDVAAKRIGKALGYDKWPIISLLAPNGSALDEEARIVGLWDAPTVTTQLSIHMRSNGWLPSPTTHSTPHPPWVPPRPTAPR
ncbi:MAG: neutral zinc metallopeptidase [Gemmatimonadaceae bacterium]